MYLNLASVCLGFVYHLHQVVKTLLKHDAKLEILTIVTKNYLLNNLIFFTLKDQIKVKKIVAFLNPNLVFFSNIVY